MTRDCQIPSSLVLQGSFAAPEMSAWFAKEVWETAPKEMCYLLNLPQKNHSKI